MEKKIFTECSLEELKMELTTDVVEKVNKIIENLVLKETRQAVELFTIEELVKLFKVDRSTINNWCKNGRLKPKYLGKRVYFLKSDIEDLFTAQIINIKKDNNKLNLN